MTNLNTQQIEAIEFFEDNYQDVQSYGLHILGGREERQLYRQGRELIDQQIVALVKVIDRTPLEAEEIQPIVEEYLLTYQDGEQVKVFDRYTAASGVADFRKNRVATAMAVHGQIVYLDTENTSIQKCFDRCGKTLKSALAQVNKQLGYRRFDV